MRRFFFFFKQKTAYEIASCLVGSDMCIRGRALVALPSIRIMQGPHAPSEHPFLTEVSPSSSRRKVSRRSSRSVETVFPCILYKSYADDHPLRAHTG